MAHSKQMPWRAAAAMAMVSSLGELLGTMSKEDLTLTGKELHDMVQGMKIGELDTRMSSFVVIAGDFCLVAGEGDNRYCLACGSESPDIARCPVCAAEAAANEDGLGEEMWQSSNGTEANLTNDERIEIANAELAGSE